MNMTKEQFEIEESQRLGLTLEAYQQEFDTVSCDNAHCEYEGCQGWVASQKFYLN